MSSWEHQKEDASQTRGISIYQLILLLNVHWKWDEMDKNKIISVGEDRIVASQHGKPLRLKLVKTDIGHPNYSQNVNKMDWYLFVSYLLTRWEWAITKIETNVLQATDIKNHFAVSFDSKRQSFRKTLSNQQESKNEKIEDAN